MPFTCSRISRRALSFSSPTTSSRSSASEPQRCRSHEAGRSSQEAHGSRGEGRLLSVSEERSMERTQREPYAAEKEHELREHDERIVATAARAQEARADEAIEEIRAVRALQANLTESVERLKHADEDGWEALRSDVEEALSTLAAALAEINARLDELEAPDEAVARVEAARRSRPPSHL